MISGSTLDVGGNQPEFSVNGIFSPRDCRKQSANFTLWSKTALSITPLSNLASIPVFGWGVGIKFRPLFSSDFSARTLEG